MRAIRPTQPSPRIIMDVSRLHGHGYARINGNSMTWKVATDQFDKKWAESLMLDYQNYTYAANSLNKATKTVAVKMKDVVNSMGDLI